MLGSVRAITGSNGALQECYDYMPFGRMLSSSDNGRSGTGCHPAPAAVSGNNIGSNVSQKFIGQPNDNGTGLDYFGARFYSASMGRFTSPDPVVITSGRMAHPNTLNLYAYANNNPLRFADPSGLDSVPYGEANSFADASNPFTPVFAASGFPSFNDLIYTFGWTSDLVAAIPWIQFNPLEFEHKNNMALWAEYYYDKAVYARAAKREALIAAQDAARNNPAFQKDDNGNTYCNQATAFIASRVGAPMGPLANSKGVPFLANDQAKNLAKSYSYSVVSRDAAQLIANGGDLVIAAYYNPNGSGHVATVRPTGVEGDSPKAGGRGPLINDIGGNIGIYNENFTFKPGMTVIYYTPRW